MGIPATAMGWNRGTHNDRPFNSGPIGSLLT